MHVLIGKSLQTYLWDLNKRKSAKEQYSKSIKYLINIAQKIFSRLDLNRHPIVIVDHATTSNIKIIADLLQSFDKNYDMRIGSKS